ncbi:MAG: DegV family protein [Oscillospiraceae bacterium]|jgi:DegV family protein with EDD domain|nr:DegV family protein [Oscillospiraceae bacterium]
MPKPILLSTDSTADLPPEDAQRYQVSSLPIYINLFGMSFRDGIDISPAEIFTAYAEQRVIPTTSAIPVGDYEDYFTRLTENGTKAVLHFCLGGEISSSYRNAVIAAKELEDVYVIDSESMSVGMALQIIRAGQWRDKGSLSAAELAEVCLRERKRVRTTALLGSPTYMHKSGRCSAVSALGANLLSIRPMLGMTDGRLGVIKKLRGKSAAVQHEYISILLEESERIDPSIGFLYHTGVSPEEFASAVAQVEGAEIFRELRTGHGGSVLCTHCGDRCLIFMYMYQE